MLRTPGHTPCSVSYQWRDRVFCGELLQVREPASRGATADPPALWESATSLLFTLAPSHELGSGHVDQRFSGASFLGCYAPWRHALCKQ